MTATLAFVIILVFLALVFDYINGFHDAANSIATVVSTRVLSPGMAVLWAAFFNFVAFATRVPNTANAMKLKKAAQITARPGESTRVETTVAMELAAS